MVELSGDAKYENFERPIAFENVLAERGWLADARSAQSSGHNGHGRASSVDTSCLTEKHNLHLQLLPYKHFLVKSTASSTCAPLLFTHSASHLLSSRVQHYCQCLCLCPCAQRARRALRAGGPARPVDARLPGHLLRAHARRRR